MNEGELAPWLVAARQQLAGVHGGFPQSLLLVGQQGIGKSDLAQHLASALLCENPAQAGQACGQCQQCRLFGAGNHPDFHVVLTEKESAGEETRLAGYGMRYLTDNQRKPGRKKRSEFILIDQIRELSANIVSTPQLANKTVVLISPADSLNRNAANSLLKVLEEPVNTTYFLLLAHRIASLPATIRSRCQHVHIPLPARDQSLEWLTGKHDLDPQEADITLGLAAGAPKTALEFGHDKLASKRSDWLKSLSELAQNPGAETSVASQWNKTGARTGLFWLYGWVRDLVVFKVRRGAPPPAARLFNADCEARLRNDAKRLDLVQLMTFLSLVEQRLALLGRSSADELLILEEVLGNWSNLFSEQR